MKPKTIKKLQNNNIFTNKIRINKSYKLKLAEFHAYLNEFEESKNILNAIIDSLDLNSSLYKLILTTYSNLSDYNTILKFSENYINLFPKDKDGYEMYMKKISMRKNQKETVRGLVREVNELREDFKEIKNLLTKMVNTNGR